MISLCCINCKELGLVPNDNNTESLQNEDEQDIPGNPVGPTYRYPVGPTFRKRRKLKAFVEPAPSHDPSKPCFAAYLANYPISVEFDDDDHPPAHRRPLFGIRIYDVTPQAGDAGRIRDLAVKFNFLTGPTLHGTGSGPYYDRFEVTGMPLDPQQLSDREKARICADYDERERVTRLASGDAGFYMPLRMQDRLYRRALVMIDRLEITSGWEDHLLTDDWSEETQAAREMDPGLSRFGTFSVVHWQPRTEGWEENEEPAPPADHVHLTKYPFELFAMVFGDSYSVRDGIARFYEHFVRDGRLDQELRRAKEAAQVHD